MSVEVNVVTTQPRIQKVVAELTPEGLSYATRRFEAEPRNGKMWLNMRELHSFMGIVPAHVAMVISADAARELGNALVDLADQLQGLPVAHFEEDE